MPSRMIRRAQRGRLGLYVGALALATALGCSNSAGCGGCGQPLTKAIKFPIENGIQLRVTSSGFDFIEQNLRPLLQQFLPGGLNFCVPGQCGEYGFDLPWWLGGGHVTLIRYAFCHNANDSCGGATPYHDGTCTNACQLGLNIAEFDIRPNNAADTLQIYLRFDQISTNLHVALDSSLVDLPGSCSINIRSNSFPVLADLHLEIDPATKRLTFDQNLNARIDTSNLDLRFGVSGNMRICDPFGLGICVANVCDLLSGLTSLLNIDFLRNLIINAVQGPVQNAVNSFADSIRCVQCGGAGQAQCRLGTSCQSGKCVFTGGPSAGQCVPTPVGTEAELDAGNYVQALSPGLHAILRFAAYAGGYVDVVNDGVSTGMITGADSEPSTCVPDAAPPATSPVPRATVLDGNTVPCAAGDTACAQNPTPYKAGVAVSERIFNHIFYSIYRSGLLCLNVGSELSDFLSTDNFALFLPSLAKLTGGKNRPMMLHVRPTTPPVVNFGSGRLRRDASGALVLENGMPVIEDPLITLRIPDLKLIFHAMIDDRFVKLFDIKVDVVLPLAVYFRADGSMAPVVGDLRQAFTNTRVSPSAILKEEADVLGSIIDVALAQALPLLSGAIENASVQIPTVQGFRLVLDDRRLKTFEAGTPVHKFVGLFSDLQYMTAHSLRQPVHASARLAALQVPSAKTYPLATMDEHGRPVRPLRASAVVELGGDGPGGVESLEWQWRLDRGPWSIFTPSRRIRIESAMLLLQGEHVIEVRARHREHQTQLSEIVAVRAVVDTIAPKLSLSRDGNLLRFGGSDSRTPPDRLAYAVSVDGAPFQEVGNKTFLSLDGLAGGAHRVAVRVRDEAGNEATDSRVFATHGRTTGSTPSPGCGGAGCGVGGETGGGLSALAALFACLALLRRGGRRSRFLTTTLVACAALFFTAACSEGTPAPVDDGGPKRCLSDADCAAGQKCLTDSGLCVDTGGCRTDADCGEGRYCAGDLDGDGRRDCAFKRCTADSECVGKVSCQGAQIPVCRDGACGCADPCGGACPDGKFCCLSSNACQDVPHACVIACTADAQCNSFGVNGRCASGQCTCADGYRLDVRSQGTVDDKICSLQGASCACAENPPIALGDVGRWSGATVVGGTLFVSAYNTTYGDLDVGRYDGMAGTFTWMTVDGAPSAPVSGAPSGPRGGVLDPGPDVGTDTRIVGAADGTLHVAYHDVTNGKLKYARGVPGAAGAYLWSNHVVDGDGLVGRYTSIVLDQAGKPAIAYMTLDVVDGAQHKSRARVARAKNLIPSGAADWDLVTLHEVALPAQPCGGACPRGQACLQNAQGFACVATTNDCATPCTLGQVCVATACVTPHKLSSLVGLPEGTGLFNSLALSPDGRLFDAFYDRTHGNLVLVAINGTATSAPMIIDGQNAHGDDTGDVGQWASLAIGADGRRHLTYVNATTDELWYAVVDDQGGATARVIDTGLRTSGGEAVGPNNPPPQGDPSVVEEHLVGDDGKLVVEPSGAVRVAYMDSTQLDLMYAKLDPASGRFSIETLAGNEVPYAGAFGFHVSHVQDGARWRIVSYKFDLKNDASGVDVRFAP